MPKSMDYYSDIASKQLAPVYKEQQKGVQQQIKSEKEDPYYNQVLKGLETAKTKAFGEIAADAARRGATYSTTPTYNQSAYLGETYLPAVAEVKREQLNRINELKNTLSDIRAERAQTVADRAYDLYGVDVEQEATKRQNEWDAKQARLKRQATLKQTRLQNKWDAEQARLDRQAKQKRLQTQRQWKAKQNALDRSDDSSGLTANQKSELLSSMTDDIRESAETWAVGNYGSNGREQILSGIKAAYGDTGISDEEIEDKVFGMLPSGWEWKYNKGYNPYIAQRDDELRNSIIDAQIQEMSGGPEW